MSKETPWSSHACCLLRRAALRVVGGYDESIFMYGEDVELSYRLRAAGYRLCYVPDAVVVHHSHQQPGTPKALQHLGSAYANLLIRCRYGSIWSRLCALPMALANVLRKPPASMQRARVLHQLLRLPGRDWVRLLCGRISRPTFGIRGNRYALERAGDWLAIPALPATQQVVSIIVRTYSGRRPLLQQAIVSCLHQTWRNLEILLIEDGCSGRSFADIGAWDDRIRYLPQPKKGRAAAGNAGMAAARGDYLMFLDDDDLLFPDHVEVLMDALAGCGGNGLAYADSLEVPIDRHHLAVTLKPVRAPHPLYAVQHVAWRNPFPIQSVLFSRRLYETLGGFDESLDWLEDWDLWKRYFPAAELIGVCKITSLYRAPGDFIGVLRRQRHFARYFSKRHRDAPP
ncbi:MAG TPA: glycosyltransferase [Rhodanobacteraceae bacterium]|nr:glycosyltransferase [Rhodanobacteraceae bacterium]